MPFFQNAQNTDARYGTFNEYTGDHKNYGLHRSTGDGTVVGHGDEVEGAKPKHHVVDFPDHVNGWDICIHPDGWKYFCSGGLITGDERVASRHPSAVRSKSASPLPDDCEEVLWYTEPKDGSGNYEMTKTYVNHSLWYASLDEDMVNRTDHTPEEAFNLKIAYWNFMYQYPSHRTLHSGAERAARESLNFYIMEGLRRRADSRAPFPLDESRELLEMLDKSDVEIQSLDIPPPSGRVLSQSSARTVLVSWILLNVAYHSKTIQYGLKTKEQIASSVPVRRLSAWFTLVSFVCFGSPFSHRERIATARRNSEVRGDEKTWPAYIEDLVREWSTFNLAATVLLSASMGLLSAPGLDPATRIAALLSVVLTLGSVIMSIYLLWRHQSGVEYNISLVKTTFQEEALAVILSIPFVSLTWGVSSFLVAIIMYPFLGLDEGLNPSTSRATSITTVVSSGIVIVVLGASIGFFRLFRLHE